MNIDPEYDNFVEFQDISTDTERYIFDYLFSAKCSNPLDIVSNSNFIKFVNFRTGCLQNKLKTMMSFSQTSNISIRNIVVETLFKKFNLLHFKLYGNFKLLNNSHNIF